MDNSGYTLGKWSLGGTAVGALLSVPFLLFDHGDRWLYLFAVLTSTGGTVGWIVAFLKLGGEP